MGKTKGYEINNQKIFFKEHFMTGDKLIHKYGKDLNATIFRLCGSSPKIIFDVGANMGVYTSLMAKYYENTAHIYAFEPVDFNFRCLEGNMKLNNIKNVSIYNFGFFSKEIEMDLGIPFHRKDIENTGLYTCLGDRKNLTKCSFKKMNDFIINNDIEKIDIMKMDVEGAEFDILSSSEDVLDRIQYLYIELNTNLIGDDCRVVEILDRHGFSLIKKRRANYLYCAKNT